jgi:hypothetical protein
VLFDGTVSGTRSLTNKSQSNVPVDFAGRANRVTERSSLLPGPISEHPDEDNGGELNDGNAQGAAGSGDDGNDVIVGNPAVSGSQRHALPRRPVVSSLAGSRSARSLQMYSNIQSLAANVASESRIASITVGDRSDQVDLFQGSIARSRMERSMRQREVMSFLEGDQDVAAHDEALNEKALKVIRRVQDKLTGTDFVDNDGVADQVQRLIVQASSTENLCQLFVGWCAFW